MKQHVRQIKTWKLNVLGVLTALLIITFACNEELDDDLREISKNSYQAAEIPDAMKKQLQTLKEQNPGQDYKYVEILLDSDDESEEIQRKLAEVDIDQRLIAAIDINKEERIIGLLLKEGNALEYASNKTRQDGEVFTIVDDAPTYEGGMEAFYRYVGENISYPAEAREQGIEGRVYVQFVVNKDGSISDVEAVKGIGGGCDEEAMKIVRDAPAFQPGRQKGEPVRVRMVMPIIFKFPDSTTEEKTEVEGETLEETVVVGYQ